MKLINELYIAIGSQSRASQCFDLNENYQGQSKMAKEKKDIPSENKSEIERIAFHVTANAGEGNLINLWNLVMKKNDKCISASNWVNSIMHFS